MNKIGYIETMMNEIIFRPRDRSEYDDSYYPDYIKKIKDNGSNDILTYTIIHPEYKSDQIKSDLPYILWSHGNACDLIDSYSELSDIYKQLKKQVGIISYDYQGYGLSSGTCSEFNCYHDLDKMVTFCTNELLIPKNRLFLLGQSLGSGVVVDYVSKTKWETPIILLSPYKTISRVIVDPHLQDIGTNMLLNLIDRFCSIDKIASIIAPIIIYHGIKDSLIHCGHSIELWKKNKKNIILILLKSANHNDLITHIDMRDFWNIIFNHINKS